MKFSLKEATFFALGTQAATITKVAPSLEDILGTPGDVPTYDGTCPEVYGDSSFNLAEYISTPWWNTVTSPFFWYSENSACVSATYVPSVTYPGYVVVYNTAAYQFRNPAGDYADYFQYTSKGMASVDESKVGTLNVQFPYPTLPVSDTMDNYIVMSTDNESYSWVWSCSQFPLRNSKQYRPVLWILNKDQNMTEEIRNDQVTAAIEQLINQFGWDRETAETFGQTMYTLPSEGCTIPEHVE